jgi:hypothetical protein
MRRTLTLFRDGWQVRVETSMRMSCTRETFLLEASMRAFDGDEEICRREWNPSIPRNLV